MPVIHCNKQTTILFKVLPAHSFVQFLYHSTYSMSHLGLFQKRPNFVTRKSDQRLRLSTNMTYQLYLINLIYSRMVNLADCRDMECDGMKNVLFEDTDGSFLEFVGSVTAEAERNWNRENAYGVGDYRIPKDMQMTLDGYRLDIDEILDFRGMHL